MKRSLLVLTIGLLWSTFADARYEEQRNGKEMLQKLCARCHSVGRTGASPNRLAPPFRTFSETKLYDSDFMQRLQDGLTSIHPFMPTFGDVPIDVELRRADVARNECYAALVTWATGLIVMRSW